MFLEIKSCVKHFLQYVFNSINIHKKLVHANKNVLLLTSFLCLFLREVCAHTCESNTLSSPASDTCGSPLDLRLSFL